MKVRLATGSAAHAMLLTALLAVSGCSHLHWPWHHKPPPPPAAVHELDISGSATPAQYWQRNTLVIDLSPLSGAGQIVLKPAAGNSWPVRLAFRVTPGAFGALEVQGAQRAVLPIHPLTGPPVDLELAPGLYRPDTPQITASWGAAASP
ncbi:MAG: hypothetical protein ACLPQ6_00675 [Steroidobacteraceae bacterium]|jgi:hypothetical protein